MAVARHCENIELQEEDDIYENVETRPRPTAQEKPPQETQQSDIRQCKRVGVGVGLLFAVLTLLNIAVPLYLYQSNTVERDQLLASFNHLQANLTEERDQLLANLTEERDQLLTSFDQLKRTLLDKPKVAFSAGLGGTVGKVSSDTTLVYKRVFTNIGNAYSQSTGIFTAPLKGVYRFTFTAAVHGTSSEHVRIQMYKNEQMLINNFGYNDHGKTESISNGLIIELEQGDTVYMRVPSGHKLYDNDNNNNIFSGVLIYPM